MSHPFLQYSKEKRLKSMHKYEAVSSLNQAYYTLKLYNMQNKLKNLN